MYYLGAKRGEPRVPFDCLEEALGFRVSCFGVWVWGLGSGVWGLGFGVRALGLGFGGVGVYCNAAEVFWAAAEVHLRHRGTSLIRKHIPLGP